MTSTIDVLAGIEHPFLSRNTVRRVVRESPTHSYPAEIPAADMITHLKKYDPDAVVVIELCHEMYGGSYQRMIEDLHQTLTNAQRRNNTIQKRTIGDLLRAIKLEAYERAASVSLYSVLEETQR